MASSLTCDMSLLADIQIEIPQNKIPAVTLYRDSKNNVQALKYPSAHAVTLYMPGLKAIN